MEKIGMTEHTFAMYNRVAAVERRYTVSTKKNGSSLSKRQMKTALELVKSGLSIDEFSESCSISKKELYDWIGNDVFIEYVSALADKYAHASEPFVRSKLLKLIKEDNVQAIRLFFSIDKKQKSAVSPPLTADKEIEDLRHDIFGKE